MFLNRQEAGLRLAVLLSRSKILNDPVLVAIPRGGVVVGWMVSQALGYLLSALVVKKIGAPDNPEFAIGAVGPEGNAYWEEDVVKSLKIDDKTRLNLLRGSANLVKLREESYGIKFPDIKGRQVVLIDDGVATGSTSIAASEILKKKGAKSVILATPLISKRTKIDLLKYFEKIISVLTPRDFSAVGKFYRDFPQVEDEEVMRILKKTNF